MIPIYVLLFIPFFPGLFVYFLYKKSAFCLKMSADFFVLGQFDQKTKNEKLNEPDIKYEVETTHKITNSNIHMIKRVHFYPIFVV